MRWTIKFYVCQKLIIMLLKIQILQKFWTKVVAKLRRKNKEKAKKRTKEKEKTKEKAREKAKKQKSDLVKLNLIGGKTSSIYKGTM